MTSEEWNELPDKYLEELKKKYPIENLEREFERIEKLGYTVACSEDSCQIYDDSTGKMIIDADFRMTMYENAVDAIDSFWND